MQQDTSPSLPIYEQNLAKETMRCSATVLLLDVPLGSVIGINKRKHICGPKFTGVKMMPPGAHLISFNTVSKEGDFSPTLSFFVYLKAGEVITRCWNSALEMLLPIEDEDEVFRLKQGVANLQFDDGLAPYNYPMHEEWKALTGYITSDLISQLSPLNGGLISIVAEAAPLSSKATRAEEQLQQQLNDLDLSTTPAQASSRDQDNASSAVGLTDATLGSAEGKPAQPLQNVGRCYYTRIPRHAKVDSKRPEELTAANLDKTSLLKSLIQQKYNDKSEKLLGELQFAFLTFLIGQSLEGFSQWKSIIHLMLSCEAAPLQSLPLLYAKFLTVIEKQIHGSIGSSKAPASEQMEPMGVPMIDELLGDSFLKKLFKDFFELLEDNVIPVHPMLQEAVDSLQSILEKELQWRFRIREFQEFASDDEYAPVIVDHS